MLRRCVVKLGDGETSGRVLRADEVEGTLLATLEVDERLLELDSVRRIVAPAAVAGVLDATPPRRVETLPGPPTGLARPARPPLARLVVDAAPGRAGLGVVPLPEAGDGETGAAVGGAKLAGGAFFAVDGVVGPPVVVPGRTKALRGVGGARPPVRVRGVGGGSIEVRRSAVPVVACEAAEAGREEPADGTSDCRGFVGEVDRSRLTEDEVDAMDEAADSSREAEGVVVAGTDVAGTREALGLVVTEADEVGRVGGREDNAVVCVEAREAGRSPCGSYFANNRGQQATTTRGCRRSSLTCSSAGPPWSRTLTILARTNTP